MLQGSVLGPSLLTCMLFKSWDFGCSYHFRCRIYADDGQICASFDSRVPDDMENTPAKITDCRLLLRSGDGFQPATLNSTKNSLFQLSFETPYTDNIKLNIGNSKNQDLSFLLSRSLGCLHDFRMSLKAHVDPALYVYDPCMTFDPSNVSKNLS